MRQGEAARVNLDLDDLERQLSAAAGPRRSGSDDPLAELARIVGHSDSAARTSGKTAGSFDDFLVNPPRSVSEMMGAPPNRVPPLPLPAAEPPRPAEPRPEARIEPLFPQAAPPPPPVSAKPSLDQQLAEALGEMPPPLRPTLPVEESYAPPPPVEAMPSAAPVDAPAAPAAEPPARTELAPSQHSDPRFEEMLKEFDAAMRDVGAQPIQTAPAAPPAPETWTTPTVSPSLAYDPEAEAPAPAPEPKGRSRLGMALAGGVIGVALIGAAGLLAFGGGSKQSVGGAAPVIAAKPGVTKERPANPGGVEVPNQDKEILARTPTPPQAERVVPREEQPVDLTQAQRSADNQANAGGVRQIPGVIVLGPSTSQPPAAAGSSAPVAPPAQPRPVASVPITIAGQPTVEAPAVVAPSPPVVTRPIAAAPTPTVTPSAPATTTTPAAPSAPTPPAAASAQPAPGATGQNASAEPRRVRAVPIRPEESAPNRAQAQPRVVPNPPLRPAAPIQAEADDGNSPLRITPQAVRSQPQQRAAAVPPGTVPTSTSVPVTTQSTSSESAPSGGGSFAVQIAAEGSQDAAQAKFNRMRAQHSGVLGGVSPTIRSAEVNGRSVYRVRVGQMSREEAVSLCERLKADGGSCFVARN